MDMELDIASESFNPLKALYAPEYRASAKDPKVVYQNMAAFETALKRVGIFDIGKRSKSIKSDGQAGTSKKITMVHEETVQRRFQEHQMPIRREVKIKNKHNRNILTQMAQELGPLKPMKYLIDQGSRVHVVVRKARAIKGYVEGKLEMFDRHWNLLLTDVLECYEYRKHKYAYNDEVYLTQSQDCSCRLKDLGVTLPTMAVKSISRKVVQIKRQLPQLLLRGEHVVLMYSALKSNEKKELI